MTKNARQKRIIDERIIQQSMKYRSEALTAVTWLLFVSIVVKSYVLDMPLGHSTTELGIFLVALVYPFLRSLASGSGETEQIAAEKPKATAAKVLLSAVMVTLVAGAFNYWRYGHKYTGIFDPNFLLVLAIVFAAMLLFGGVSSGIMALTARRSQERIDREDR